MRSFLAIGDAQEALRVDLADVAGAQPDVGVGASAILLDQIVIALRSRRDLADEDLAVLGHELALGARHREPTEANANRLGRLRLM